MKKEKENKKSNMMDKIRSPKIAILLSDEERMRKSIEKMIDSAYEKTAKKLKRGN